MIGLRSAVEKEAARAALEKHRFDGCRSFLESVSVSVGLVRNSAERAPHHQRRLRHLELLWLPYYMITWRISWKVESQERSRTVATLVGAHELNFSLLDPKAILESLDKAAFFEPAIREDDAVDVSRTGLWRTVLNDRRSKQLLVDERPTVELVQYPFWAYYFSGLGGKLDVKLLDAVTGSLTGPKGKVALMAALANDRAATE